MTRDGITHSEPTGSSWRKIRSVHFKHVSVGSKKIFALDKGSSIFYLEGLFCFSFDEIKQRMAILSHLYIYMLKYILKVTVSSCRCAHFRCHRNTKQRLYGIVLFSNKVSFESWDKPNRSSMF